MLRRLCKNSDMPVIMLTARDTVMDKVAGPGWWCRRLYDQAFCHRRTVGENPPGTEEEGRIQESYKKEAS